MSRFFARNLLFIISLNVLVKPVWIFVIDRTVQNRVGHASYGTYQALFNMSIIMQVLLDFGFNGYNTRAISRNPDEFAARFPVMLGIRLLLSGLYAAIVVVIGYAAGYRGDALHLLYGTLLIQTLMMLLLFIRSNVAAFQRFRHDGILSVADRVFMIIICGLLLFLPVFAGSFRIEWFVWSQVGCYAAATILGFYILRRITHVPVRLSFHFEKVWHMMRGAAPYALLMFLMGVYTRADTTLIERLTGKTEAGIYAAAYRQLDVSNQFAILFAGMLLPIFGRMLSEGGNVASIVRLSANLLMPLSFLGTVMAWTAGTGIMHLLYPAAGVYDGRVFAWAMSCLPAYSLMYIYSTLLTANGALRVLNGLAAGAVVINLSLNFILIPRYGAEGAAIVACITQWCIAICSVVFAAGRNRLATQPKWLAAHAAYVILLSATGITAQQYWGEAWRPIVLTLLLAAGVMIPLFRFVTPSALGQFLSRR